MSSHPDKASEHGAERAALRRRVHQLYTWFNRGDWSRCFERIDPKIRDRGLSSEHYADSLKKVKAVVGEIRLWYVRINLYMDVENNKHDDRPFAYVYVVWRDARQEFHVFRERWVKDDDRWYTQVVGLVASRDGAGKDK